MRTIEQLLKSQHPHPDRRTKLLITKIVNALAHANIATEDDLQAHLDANQNRLRVYGFGPVAAKFFFDTVVRAGCRVKGYRHVKDRNFPQPIVEFIPKL